MLYNVLLIIDKYIAMKVSASFRVSKRYPDNFPLSGPPDKRHIASYPDNGNAAADDDIMFGHYDIIEWVYSQQPHCK